MGILVLTGCQHAVCDNQLHSPVRSRPLEYHMIPARPVVTTLTAPVGSEPRADHVVIDSLPPAAESEQKDQTVGKMNVPPAAVLEPLTKAVAMPGTDAATTSNPLCRALQAYLVDKPDEALEILSAYHPRDQEMLLHLLPMIARVENGGLLTDSMSDEEKLNLLEAFQSLTRELQASAPLVIDKLFFCEEVKGFGRGTPRPSTQYRGGDKVALYVEIQNLIDRRSSDERYVTHLTSVLEIRQGDRLIKPLPVQSMPDWSWSPRHDHFSLIRFQMPRDLDPGVYTLVVRVTDEDTQRTTQQQIVFRVASLSTVSRLP
jgi:hypothetical protein